MTLALSGGGWEAELRPEVGGALAALRFQGVEVFRTMPTDCTSPLDAACFPLVPWCNRIADGQFIWAEHEVQLPHNFPPETSSLHGLGWQRAWQVTSQAEFKCTLEHVHDGEGGWPWAYHAHQSVRLGRQGVAISLGLTNRGDSAMPCGLGLHPYFRRRPETRVLFDAQAMLEVDGHLIPTGVALPSGHFADWQAGAGLPHETIDHCFAGWDGPVTIEDDLGSIELTARGAPFLHLYAPADGSALCCEPVSHAPDAPNRWPEQMIVLPPGCSASMTMWISATLR